MLAITAGCQVLSGGRAQASANGSTMLIRYGNAVRSFDEVGLEREYARIYQAYAENPSTDSAIRLALLLSYPGASFYDPDRARQMLGGVSAQEANPSETAELANLLTHFLNERNCVTDDSAALADLFIAERNRNRELSSQLTQVRAALDAERQVRQNLQGQLDALKELEERLNADDLRE